MDRRRISTHLMRSAGGCLVALATASAAAQSELVIYKEGTRLYHRAHCPVVSGGVGVLALTRAQAESRGYKSHEECDPAKTPAAKAQAGPGAPAAPVTVYLDGTRYYHRKECAKLTGTSRKIETKPLEEAGKSHWPCPTCRPPIRLRSPEPAVPGTERRRGG